MELKSEPEAEHDDPDEREDPADPPPPELDRVCDSIFGIVHRVPATEMVRQSAPPSRGTRGRGRPERLGFPGKPIERLAGLLRATLRIAFT
jgi:hypothetical protein